MSAVRAILACVHISNIELLLLNLCCTMSLVTVVVYKNHCGIAPIRTIDV
jgi:hypothetical protein